MGRPRNPEEPELANACAEALRRERRQLGMTQGDLAQLTGYSRATISRYERGKHVIPRDVAKQFDRAMETNRVTSVLPDPSEERRRRERLARYVEVEQEEAVAIRQWQAQVIPSLVQTEDYAKAVVSATLPPNGPAEVDGWAASRMRRQEILDGDRELSVHLIVDEGAIRRIVGGPELMHKQWRHLAQVAEHPRVRLQVLPFAEGAHACLQGSYTLVETVAEDVLYVEAEISGKVLTERANVNAVRARFDSLIAMALSPGRTRTFLDGLIATEGAP